MTDEQRRKPTSTSAFGASRREGHDATDFYARFSAPVLSDDDTVNPCPVANAIFCGDSHLYTYENDVVLDPFMGAGSTAIAAIRTGRRYVGFDTDQTYVDLTNRRLADEPQPTR